MIVSVECPYCKENIKPNAIVCKHCGMNLQTGQASSVPKQLPQKKKSSGCLTFFIIVIISLIIFLFWPKGEATPEEKQKDIELSAYTVAEEYVKFNLKSPSTAKFPTYSHATISSLGNNSWRISSVVDSQNGFGAMLRSNWSVVVTYKGGDQYNFSDNWTETELSIK